MVRGGTGLEKQISMPTLLLRTTDGAQSSFPLTSGRVTAGSALSDALSIADCPAGALELEIAADGISVIARIRGVILSGRSLKPGARWLFRVGDSLSVADVELSLLAEAGFVQEGTAGLARSVLSAALAGSADTSHPTLVWLNGVDCGKRVPLLDEATFLGRGDGALARVRDAKASRNHARIVFREGRATLHDQRSGNGVFVDGVEIDGQRALYGGEILRIGDTEIAFEATLARPAPVLVEAPGPVEVAHLPAPTPPRRRRFTAVEIAMLGGGLCAGTFGMVAVWLLAR